MSITVCTSRQEGCHVPSEVWSSGLSTSQSDVEDVKMDIDFPTILWEMRFGE